MDDTLKRLLAAETAASALVDKAQKESEQLVQTAAQDARQQEERFNARIPELHAAFLEKANHRAEQSVAEMERRFEERIAQLRDAAEANEEQALEHAFQELLGGESVTRP